MDGWFLPFPAFGPSSKARVLVDHPRLPGPMSDKYISDLKHAPRGLLTRGFPREGWPA